jgi:hypothetical protein
MHTLYIEKNLQQQNICEKFLTSVNQNHPELKLVYSCEQSTDLSVIFEINFSLEHRALAEELVKKLYSIN